MIANNMYDAGDDSFPSGLVTRADGCAESRHELNEFMQRQ